MTRTNVLRSVLVLPMVVMATSLFAQTRPVRVYVFAAEGKSINEASNKGRADSVADLRKAFATNDQEVTLVATAAEAELRLVVLGRGYAPTGWTSTSLDSLTVEPMSEPESQATILAKMIVGDYSTEITGQCQLTRSLWGEAAKDLTGKVVRWIKNNGAYIPRK